MNEINTIESLLNPKLFNMDIKLTPEDLQDLNESLEPDHVLTFEDEEIIDQMERMGGGNLIGRWSQYDSPISKEEEDRINKAYRTSHQILCETCGKTYLQHPMYLPSGRVSYDRHPFLHELCNGDLVKL